MRSGSKEAERLALIRQGVADIAHDLRRCEREGLALIETQMSSMDAPCPASLVEAYDEVVRTSNACQRHLDGCVSEIVELLMRRE